MINLIPPKAKKGIIFEYWIRVVSVWMILGSFVLLLGAAVLFPVYVLIGVQISDDAIAATEKVNNYENISSQLIRASEQARYIKEESNYDLFSEYLNLFEELKGTAVILNQIQVARKENEVAPVILNGIADDRQSLASFRDRLLSDKNITSVDLPISNLARDKDIPFSITVVLNNEES